jgi:hypothetical protein
VTENPAVAPSANDPRLKPLHAFSNESWVSSSSPKTKQPPAANREKNYTVVELTEVAPDALALLRDESSATESARKIAELTEKLASREAMITELRSGGVGLKASGAAKGGPMEFEQLADAFQQRYFDTRLQVKQLEVQIADLARSGDNPQELEDLKMQLDAITHREQVWVKKLAATIEMFLKVKKAA